jgi:DNA-binding transcriptional MerR regulator
MVAAPRQAPPEARKPVTIGGVRRLLAAEFPDISISKIRFLEDQGLLSPGRTPSGYRLFDDNDVERLRAILQLQRDEFLPLRVIREELSSPGGGERRRRAVGLRKREPELELAELCRRARIAPSVADELVQYGLLRPRLENGENVFSETDAEIAHLCARIAEHGVDARHLRAFRHAADRVGTLLEQVTAPMLHSRNSERRRAALADLETLLGQSRELVYLLVWRDLHELVAR